MTFENLNRVIEYSSEKFENGHWSEKEVMSYTSSHGINRLGQNKIIAHCCNKMAHNLYKDEVNNEDGLLVTQDYEKYPDKYCRWKGGPYWKSNLKLFQFVDVLMHLLFLGITKSTREIIYDWIVESKRQNEYKLFSNIIFNLVSDMGLDWCKLLVSKSGWVSDNYVAFARISKWFYYPIVILHQNEVYNEPKLPINKWYLNMCKEWLKAYGYDTNGRVNDLRKKIINMKNDPSTVLKLNEHKCGSEQEISNLIGSMLSMIASVMKREVSHESVGTIEREIKIFLTNLHIVDVQMNKDFRKNKNVERKPFWMTRYNHLSLLNIPKSIRLFGPMINLWEGSNQGEGYLRFAKPKLTNIHCKNWQQNAHADILIEMSFDEVIENHVNNNLMTGMCSNIQNYTNSRMNREKNYMSNTNL